MSISRQYAGWDSTLLVKEDKKGRKSTTLLNKRVVTLFTPALEKEEARSRVTKTMVKKAKKKASKKLRKEKGSKFDMLKKIAKSFKHDKVTLLNGIVYLSLKGKKVHSFRLNGAGTQDSSDNNELPAKGKSRRKR